MIAFFAATPYQIFNCINILKNYYKHEKADIYLLTFACDMYDLYCSLKKSNVFENVAAIPSILFGLFSYAVFVYMLGFGRCILSGGIALAFMIFPFLERKIEKSFLEVDKNLLIASYNLGIDTRKTFMKIVLPQCIKEIISSVILALLFAMSATAPILFTGGVAFATVPNSIMKPAMALPLHLYLMIAQGSSQINRAYGVAAVSLIILFLFSTVAYCLSFKKGKKVKS